MSDTPVKPRRTSWGVTVPLAAGVIAYLIWGFFPGMKALRETREEIKRQRQYIAQADLMAPAIMATEQELLETEEFCQQARPAVGQNKTRGDVQARIMRLATEQGLARANLVPLPPVDLESLQQQPLTVSISGGFAKISQFLAGIESLPQAIWVSDLRIEGNQRDNKGAVSELKLEVFAGRSEISD